MLDITKILKEFKKLQEISKDIEYLTYDINGFKATVYKDCVDLSNNSKIYYDDKIKILKLLEINVKREYLIRYLDNCIILVKKYKPRCLYIRGVHDIENINIWSIQELKDYITYLLEKIELAF